MKINLLIVSLLTLIIFSNFDMHSENIAKIQKNNQDVLLSTSLNVVTDKTVRANNLVAGSELELSLDAPTSGILQSNTLRIPTIDVKLLARDDYVGGDNGEYSKNDIFFLDLDFNIIVEFSDGYINDLGSYELHINETNPVAQLTQMLSQNVVANGSVVNIKLIVNNVNLNSGGTQLNGYILNFACKLSNKLKPNFSNSTEPIIYIGDEESLKVINHVDLVPTNLNWTFHPDYNSQVERPNSYQIQILKLHNIDNSLIGKVFSDSDGNSIPKISATVNWDDAITFETGSELTNAWFFITDGTGYYVWRVRPIGNYNFGNSANYTNYGLWASYLPDDKTQQLYSDGDQISIYDQTTLDDFKGFFYFQPESDKNWTFQQFYFEDYSDSTKIASAISYADGLLNPLQSQRYVYSDDIAVVQHSVLDYSAQPSLITLPVPIATESTTNISETKSNISFKSDIIKSGSEIYSAKHFDGNTKYLNIDPADAGIFQNYYGGDIPSIPSAEGYPFSRVIDFGDESIASMPGATHKIDENDQHNTRVIFAAISSDELLAVMGKERPVASAIYKEIIIDENKNISYVYKNKFGKTIATAISSNSVDFLESLNNDPINVAGSRNTNVELWNPKLTKNKDVESNASVFLKGDENPTLDFSVGNIPQFMFSDDCISTQELDVPLKDVNLGYIYSDYGISVCETIIESDPIRDTYSQTMNGKSVNINSVASIYNFYLNYSPDYSAIETFRNDYQQNVLNPKFQVAFGALLDSIAYYLENDISIELFYEECFVSNNFPNWTYDSENHQYNYDYDCVQLTLPELTCGTFVDEDLYDSVQDTVKWNNFEQYLIDKAYDLEYNYIDDKNNILLNDISKYIYVNGQRVYSPQDLYETDGTNSISFVNRIHPINTLIYNMKDEEVSGNLVYSAKHLASAWQFICDNYEDLAFHISDGKSKADDGLEGMTVFNRNFDIIKEFLNLTGRMYVGISNFCKVSDGTAVANDNKVFTDNSKIKVYGKDFIQFAHRYFAYVDNSDDPDNDYQDYVVPTYNTTKQNWEIPYADWKIDFDALENVGEGDFEYPSMAVYFEKIKAISNTSYTTLSDEMDEDEIGFVEKDENYIEYKTLQDIYERQQASLILNYYNNNLAELTNADSDRNQEILGDDATIVDETIDPYDLDNYSERDIELINEQRRKTEYMRSTFISKVRDAYNNIPSVPILPEVDGVASISSDDRFLDLTLLYDDVKMLAESIKDINSITNAGMDLPGYATDIDVANQYKRLDTMITRGDFKLVHIEDVAQQEVIFNTTKVNEIFLSHLGKHFSTFYFEKFLLHLQSKLAENIKNILGEGTHNLADLCDIDVRASNRDIIVEEYSKYLGISQTEVELYFADPTQDPYLIDSDFDEFDLTTIGFNNGLNRVVDQYGNYIDMYSEEFQLGFIYVLEYLYLPETYEVTIRDENGTFEDYYQMSSSIMFGNKNSIRADETQIIDEDIKLNNLMYDVGTTIDYSGSSSTMSFIPTMNFKIPLFSTTWFGYKIESNETYFPYRNYAFFNLENLNLGYSEKYPQFFIDYHEYDAESEYDDAVLVESTNCSDVLYNQLYAEILNQFSEWKFAKLQNLDDQIKEFKENDLDYQIEYELNYTDGIDQNYTLFYYDRKGNLIRSVPPAGVHYDATADETDQIDHDLATRYRYDGNDKLLKQKSPDESDESFVVYNDAGQMRFSVSPNQISDGSFSYLKYDIYGRVIESGEAYVSKQNDFDFLNNKAQTDFDNALFGDDQYPASSYVISRSKTFYSQPFSKIVGDVLQKNIYSRVSYVVKEQIDESNEFFTVSEVAYSYDPMGNVQWLATAHLPNYNSYQGISHSPQILALIKYEYDLVSGKVTQVDFTALRKPEPDFDQGAFPLFDLWQIDDITDFRFIQKYKYDTDNRIIEVASSRDSILWESDARYRYYMHGPLQRTEYGTDLLQGVDYTYTIQGWLKGINNSQMNTEGGSLSVIFNNPAENDPGGDYYTVGHEYVQDYFGSVIDYYNGDFVNNTDYFDRSSLYTTIKDKNYYNGNINAVEQGFNSDVLTQTGLSGFVNTVNNYNYDKLYRLTSFENYSYFNGYNPTTTNANYTYDPSGNIESLDRTVSGVNFDDLSYTYTQTNGFKQNNMLRTVTDAINTQNYGTQEFYDDEVYGYDSEGNLTRSNNKQISWNISGKIDTVTVPLVIDENNTYNGDDFFYGTYDIMVINFYDAAGNRIFHNVKSDALYQDIAGHYGVQHVDTYRALKHFGLFAKISFYDANNLLLASFSDFNTDDVPYWDIDAWYLYGSGSDGRVAVVEPYQDGEFPGTMGYTFPDEGQTIAALGDEDSKEYYSTRQIGHKHYEITDHLGNVKLTFSDYKYREEYSLPRLKVISKSDYFPFGMLMPENYYQDPLTKARFGFNGMERDDEIAGVGNSFNFGARQYDSRIARFNSLDNYRKIFTSLSPYMISNNNPIRFIDKNGNYASDPWISAQWADVMGTLLTKGADEAGKTAEKHDRQHAIDAAVIIIVTEEVLKQTINELGYVLYQYGAAGVLDPKTLKTRPYKPIFENVDFDEDAVAIDATLEMLPQIGIPLKLSRMAKRIMVRTADVVNKLHFLSKNWKAAYTSGSVVAEFVLSTKQKFVRVITKGKNKVNGAFLMKAEDLLDENGKMLTPEAIKNKFSLPIEGGPTHILDVDVPAGTKMRAGSVAPVEEFGTDGGGFQYELLEEIPIESFQNLREINNESNQ